MRPRTPIAGALAVALLPLSACSTPDSANASSMPANTLVMSTPTEPDVLDPTFANTFAARIVFAGFCEKLYDVDSRLHIVPQLAAELPKVSKVSKDGLSLDIPLRRGIRFNDGTPFDAAAVRTTLHRNLTAEGSGRVSELSAVKKVEVKNASTVHIELKRPFAPLAAQLVDRAGMIMSPAALHRLGADFGTAPVCVGPFRFQDRVSGNEISFTKSPYYYARDRVRLDGLVHRFINSSSVATANLESGDVHAAEHLDASDASDASDALKLRDEPGLRVLKADTIAYQSVQFNARRSAGTRSRARTGRRGRSRDVLARICSGARVSLLAGVMSTVLAMAVGIPVGLAAGFYRGWTDSVLIRINDTVLSFPFLIFAVGLAAILGPSLRNVVLALAVAESPSVVRVVRGETMVLREQDFVQAAVADGAGDLALMTGTILPNTTSTLIVRATVAIPAAVIGEAAPSFLGLGVQPPAASWGVMLTSAQQFLSQDPLLALFPGVAIALTTLGFNLLGDGLRDVLDPRGL